MRQFAIMSAFGTAALLAGLASAQSAPGERPRAVLFDGVSFGGAPQPIVLETPNLGAQGFNNRASSIDVRAGEWQVCTDRNFSGRCEVLGPGRHNLAAHGMDNLISSIRPVTQANKDMMEAPLVLHTKKNFDGERIVVESDHADLSSVSFNDAARSITVNKGVWEVCSEPDYLGTCSYMRGSEPNLGAIDLSRKVSSVRMVEQLKDPAEYAVVVYPDRNYKGAYRGIDSDVDQLDKLRFDNRARSIRVNSGEWLVCEQRYFLGRCEVLSASVKDLKKINLSHEISSIRRYSSAPAPTRVSKESVEASLPVTDTSEPGVEGEATIFYAQPMINGVRVSYCDPSASCGLAAANAFCDSKGHSGASHYVANASVTETAYTSGENACLGSSCRALSDVLCAK